MIRRRFLNQRRGIYSAAGKYKIRYEPYERYGGSSTKSASFSAKSDLDACKKIADKLGLYVDSEQINPDPEDIDELMDEYGEVYTDVDSAIQAMTEEDGQDFIFWIKRPDGSYLYDSGAEEEEDW